MNKDQLIGALSSKTGMPRQQAKLAVDGLLSVVTEALGRHEAVRLIGFGTFTTTRRPAGAVRNPRTGQSVLKPAHVQVSFRAGGPLKNSANKTQR